jgi:hypothetical protein
VAIHRTTDVGVIQLTPSADAAAALAASPARQDRR